MSENKKKLNSCYQSFIDLQSDGIKGFAVLVDPDHFCESRTNSFIRSIPTETTHIFVGGSKIVNGETEQTVRSLKKHCSLPIVLFPGDATQITNEADGILFLSLLSGRNPDYLIGQQVASIPRLMETRLDIISMGYILVDGGSVSAVQKVSNTEPMSQDAVKDIADTALAGEYLGMKLIYLEAGSGAKIPVDPKIIRAVKDQISVPLIVGGGIKNEQQKQEAYRAGADMVVMGTAFETKMP
jgi:putative glycerol-1-phosphate prenyltransferase